MNFADELAGVVVDVRRSMISAHVYSDPEILAAERDRRQAC